MKITYTAPNRAHHYPYAEAMFKADVLHAFVSGFSRFSPRGAFPQIGKKLKRHDFLQNLYILSLKSKMPQIVTSRLNALSHHILDVSSFRWAVESDVFIYYRTEGIKTATRIHEANLSTLCVLEEVNTHVDECTALLNEEHERLGLGALKLSFPDHDLRLNAYEESDYILCPSEFVKKSFLNRGFEEQKLIKVNFGFPPLELQPEKSVNSSTFRFLYVGQIHFRKGLHYAIEAFKLVKHPKKEFVIVGPRTGITGLEKTIIPDNVIFTGALKGDDLKNEFRKASVFVLPSIEEGLALVQAEALSFGKPLIITTNTGGDEFITNGVEGFIVPPSNVSQLAEKMQMLAYDQKLIEEMSFNALMTAKQLGGWDKTVETLLYELQLKIDSKYARV